ncbi:MAG: hypothetical protein J6J39_05185 [Clostridia bacterium]|nr:hypothetical protein [Clostridia bacterium]
MKAKNNKRILSLILSFALLVSMFSMCLISVSATDTDVLLDNEANSFANWSDSLNADGTLKEGKKGSLLTVNDGVWPADKTVQSVTFDLTATLQGASSRNVGFVYYYEDANNYKMVRMRETGAGLLYIGLVDYIDGVKSAPQGITFNNSPKGSMIDLNVNGNTQISIGATTSAIITISYIDSDNVSIKFSSADGSSSYTVSIADDETDATDIDFKDTAKQKFHFLVSNDSGVVYKTNSIKVQFDKDLTITGSSVTDNAANEFEHFSTYIAADGAVKVQGTAFSMNDGVWPAGKQLKKVEFDLSVAMAGAADKHIMLGYYFTDSQNYKTLEVRETGGGALYMAFVDVVNGVKTKPANMSATNSIPMNTASSKNTNVSVGFSAGATVTVEYIDSSNVKFTFTSADGATSFTTTLTAQAAANVDFKSASNKFGFFFSKNAGSPKFTDITVEWEKSEADDIAAFKSKYASVLVDTTDAALLPTVRDALAEYEAAKDEVKAGLAEQYAQLKKNFTAIIVEAGRYSTDFEKGIDSWEQFADFTDKNGSPVVQDDFGVEALGNRTGGISQSESGNVFSGASTVTPDTYTQVSNATAGYENHTSTQIENENAYAINGTMMLSPSRAIWQGAKAAGKNFASAEFDLYVNLSGSSSGAYVYYNYIDNNNFSLFRFRRGVGGLDIANVVVGTNESGSSLRKMTYINSSVNIKALNNWAVSAENWVRISIAYNEDNKAVLTLTGEPGDTHTVISNDVVDKSNRMIAFGTAPFRGTTVDVVIDNFSMVLANAETQEGVDFEVKYTETLKLSAERFAAYDAIEVDKMSAAYDALSDTAKASLKAETVAAVNALKAARALWDTTSDATVAASYKAIWGEKIATDSEKAWNVYNRLSAAQKALLSDEYDALVAAMSAKTQVTDDKININCVGDSITFGSGSTSVENYSYPSQMQAILGDGYTVSRNGIAGYQVVADYNITSPEDVELQLFGTNAWLNSHKGTDDIIIIQLGTNDLSKVAGKAQIKTDIYNAGLEKLIQSYLRLENSPLVIISNTTVSYSAISSGYADTYSTVALLNMAMAEKYGLPCVDMHAYTNAYTEDEVAAYYANDKLHPSNDGYTKMAQVFADAVKSLSATFDTADVTAYTFEENTLNSFLAPEMVSATIKKSNKAATQDLGFRTKVSKIVKTGATIVEYGTIFSKYAAANEDAILSRMVYSETADENNLVLYARGTGANAAGIEYIAGLGCAQGTETKEAYIARAYVKYSDGSVYYSVNDRKDATSYSQRIGVINGYACRSVTSIAKEMVKFLAQNGVADATIASYEAASDTLTFTAEAKANNDLIYQFLTDNLEALESLV